MRVSQVGARGRSKAPVSSAVRNCNAAVAAANVGCCGIATRHEVGYGTYQKNGNENGLTHLRKGTASAAARKGDVIRGEGEISYGADSFPVFSGLSSRRLNCSNSSPDVPNENSSTNVGRSLAAIPTEGLACRAVLFADEVVS